MARRCEGDSFFRMRERNSKNVYSTLHNTSLFLAQKTFALCFCYCRAGSLLISIDIIDSYILKRGKERKRERERCLRIYILSDIFNSFLTLVSRVLYLEHTCNESFNHYISINSYLF